MKKQDASLDFEYKLTFGKGENSNQNCAMIRPFRKIISEGKHPGKINFIFLQEKDDYFLLGSFSYTEKNILFFPSLVDQKIITHNGQSINETFVPNLDHLTLTQNLKDWHVTALEKKEKSWKVPSFHTQEIEKNVRLWFVWRVSSTKVFESPAEVTKFHFQLADSEIDRRGHLLVESMQNAIHNITKVNDDLENDFFWNLEFFVSDSTEKIFPQKNLNLQHSSKTKITENRDQIMSRTHHVQLDGFDGWIIIRISKIMGKFPLDSQFISGESFDYSNKNLTTLPF